MRRNTDDALPLLQSLHHIPSAHLLLHPPIFVGRLKAVHHHIVQKVLAIVLKGLPGQYTDFLLRSPSSTYSLDIFPDIASRLFHQEIEDISYDHTEKFLDRSRDKG
jgi:hypothetical protein